MPGERIDAAQLRDAPAGTLAAIDVRTLLDGKVTSFGQRFWKLVTDNCPRLKEKLASELRFAVPEPREHLASLDATAYGPRCPQLEPPEPGSGIV